MAALLMNLGFLISKTPLTSDITSKIRIVLKKSHSGKKHQKVDLYSRPVLYVTLKRKQDGTGPSRRHMFATFEI